ncbi:MAG: hypothetical protein ACRDT4_26680 [Micromonosporaceae bacterium]
MTTTPVTPKPGSRLDQLAALYDDARAAAEAADAHLKMVTDGIKAELSAAVTTERVELASSGLQQPLRMKAVTSWRIDTKRLKAEQPETYVRYAKQSTYWDLRRVSS